MRLTLNGEIREIDAHDVHALIARLGLTGQAAAVEVNRQVVPRSQHKSTPLHENDQVEIVTLVGGG